jgi:hypothetical protein
MTRPPPAIAADAGPEMEEEEKEEAKGSRGP